MVEMRCGLCRQKLDWRTLLEHKCPAPAPKKVSRREFLIRLFKGNGK